MQKIPMTEAGFQRLDVELRHLKTVERPRIIKAISEARAHGDLSENAEYHAAKERQGWIESRVLYLQDTLRRAEIIDLSKLGGDKIMFGATVILEDEDSGDKSTYQIVGADEADIKAGLLSITAPLARALIGKTVGDSVEVSAPGGAKAYEIVRVVFG